MAVPLVYHKKKDIKNIVKNWNNVINILRKKKNDILTIYNDTSGYYIKEHNSTAEASWKYSLFCQNLYIILTITQSHLEPGKVALKKNYGQADDFNFPNRTAKAHHQLVPFHLIPQIKCRGVSQLNTRKC